MNNFKNILTILFAGSAILLCAEEQLIDLEKYDFKTIIPIQFSAPLWVTPQKVKSDGIDIKKIKNDAGYALELKITNTELQYPGIMLPPPKGQLYWDISKYQQLFVDIENLDNSQQMMISVRVNNPPVGSYEIANNSGFGLNPGEKRTLKLYYPQAREFTKCKMSGLRATAPGIPGPKNVDGRRVYGITFYSQSLRNYYKKPSMHCRISNIRLVKAYTPPKAPINNLEIFYPFVDIYGQYKFQNWPNKIHAKSDFATMIKKEKNTLRPRIKSWNKWGGWTNGPKLKATGFFYPEKYKGKWYLVDPDGSLFFSHGINAVRSGRKGDAGYKLPVKWFPAGTRNKKGGWNFPESNLCLKFGSDYMKTYPDLIDERLQSWGINTIGNWSDIKFNQNHKTPYTMEIMGPRCPRTARTKKLKHGIWDVFSPQFESSLKKRAREKRMQGVANDPWCIGLFINNEIHWGDRIAAAQSAFASKPEQPAKIKFIEFLKIKYIAIDALNKKWGENYKNWDKMLKSQILPDPEKSFEDMLAFNIKIFDKYYSTCRKIVKKFSSNTLYLGSRIHLSRMPELYTVASKYCDVVALNIYSWSMYGLKKQGLPTDKPIMVTEFHVAVLDRGMFNADSRPAGITQEDRAHAYLRIMQGMLLHPQIVGAHYFCYRDEPLTGRWGGIKQENFAVGTVDVADTPYWVLNAMMRKISKNMMQYRLDGRFKCKWDKQ